MSEDMKKAKALLNVEITNTKRVFEQLKAEFSNQSFRLDALRDALDILEKCEVKTQAAG